jgi:alkylation response protein AidB-like acyl-CoA dehydrogenase
MGVIGLGMAGPTIMLHGTEEQKQRYLSKILSAEEIWCQGFSEPGAGSDLSAVRTRIDDESDHFVLNGQKVWSSFAHIADHCILIGRSDPDSERHAGLTYVIVDMKAPGVEVRPLKQITCEAEFNEIFYTDAKVPKENLLGEIGGGWQVAMTTLLHERGTLGFALSGVLEAQVQKVVALAKQRNGHDPIVRDRLAHEWIVQQALKFTNYRALTALMKTGMPGPEGSAVKLAWSEANQRLTKLAMEILEGEDDGYWRHQQLRSRGNTIEAGTSEILRNIVAERVLGLPRSRYCSSRSPTSRSCTAARRAKRSATAAGRATRSQAPSCRSSTAPCCTRKAGGPTSASRSSTTRARRTSSLRRSHWKR